MDQNEIDEAIVKSDEEISWDDVQEELAAAALPSEKPEIRSVSFEEMNMAESNNGGLDLDFILDIPLTLTVELGKTQMLIGDLLRLGQGSVVELSKLAGEPMDVFVNNRLIARGEVVVVNDKFGVRLTDVISPDERVSKLK